MLCQICSQINCPLAEYQYNACSQFIGTQNMGRIMEQKQSEKKQWS